MASGRRSDSWVEEESPEYLERAAINRNRNRFGFRVYGTTVVADGASVVLEVASLVLAFVFVFASMELLVPLTSSPIQMLESGLYILASSGSKTGSRLDCLVRRFSNG